MLRAVDGFRGADSSWLPSEPLSMEGRGQLLEQRCHFSCVKDVLEQSRAGAGPWTAPGRGLCAGGAPRCSGCCLPHLPVSYLPNPGLWCPIPHPPAWPGLGAELCG